MMRYTSSSAGRPGLESLGDVDISPYAKSDERLNTALAVKRVGRAGRNTDNRGTNQHLRERVICMTGLEGKD
jgi:hypothetical protein